MKYQLATDISNWHPFSQLLKEFDQDMQPARSLQTAPKMEWEENEKAYFLSFDIPGMKQEDIKIDLKENTLTISAERKQASERNTKGTFKSEKFYGVYKRALALPTDVDTDGAQAEYTNGVLEILIPKSEKAQAKSLSVGTTGNLSDRFNEKALTKN